MRTKRDGSSAGRRGFATVVLLSEHEVILSVVGALRRLLAGDGRLHDGTFWSQAIGFMLAFAARHDAKEEGVLLPYLAARGVATGDERFARIAVEHERSRALLERLAVLAPGLGAAEAAQREEFQRLAREYCDMLPAHIAFESSVLVPLLDEIVSPEDARDLVLRFRLSEHVADGEDEYDRLLMVAKQLRRAA